jgi:hypothetical protein
MFTSTVNVFNRRAERWAAAHGKPLVGNGDVHRMRQLGPTYSLVDAPADAEAICEAIAAGRVRVVSRPLSWIEVAQVLPDMMVTSLLTRRGLSARPSFRERRVDTRIW